MQQASRQERSCESLIRQYQVSRESVKDKNGAMVRSYDHDIGLLNPAAYIATTHGAAYIAMIYGAVNYDYEIWDRNVSMILIRKKIESVTNEVELIDAVSSSPASTEIMKEWGGKKEEMNGREGPVVPRASQQTVEEASVLGIGDFDVLSEYFINDYG
ncbi:hypothetical protein L2E82_25036 [Cichorium intybus]|uniref:Uncharacterized protein n=1 Tax=Cichorium intybus TaxID=13427 RepID=A0ACB9E1Y7_CICIN|nr:hypothetical protein L2E82_25036 [Cichorium intybus]